MRITPFVLFDNLARNLSEQLRDLSTYSDRLSSGKRINKPSDDIAGMMNVMDYRVTLNDIEQYEENVSEAEGHLNFAEMTMSSVADALTRARELAVEGANGTQSPESRSAIAAEIDQLRDQVLTLANSRFRDRYVFSGYRTDTESFDTSYVYQGDTNEIKVIVDANNSLALNITGDRAFSSAGQTFFEKLDDLSVALNSDDDASIQASIGTIEEALGHVANVRADLGARLHYIDKLRASLTDRDFFTRSVLSNTEDADIAETVSELTRAEVALQSLRAAGSKLLSQSLWDFLT